MEKINWSKLAIRDLNNIHDYIASDSPFYGEKTVESIFARINQLGLFPESGRIVPEFEDSRLREILEGNYRIIYRTKNRKIYIVRIHHSSRMLKLRRP